MIRLVVILLLLLASGCATAPEGMGGAFTGGGNVQANYAAIVEAAKAKPADIGLIQNLAKQGIDYAAGLMQSLEESAKANTVLRDEKVKAETQLAEERRQWFGDRLHKLVGWIIAGLLVFWLLAEQIAPLTKMLSGLKKLGGLILSPVLNRFSRTEA